MDLFSFLSRSPEKQVARLRKKVKEPHGDSSVRMSAASGAFSIQLTGWGWGPGWGGWYPGWGPCWYCGGYYPPYVSYTRYDAGSVILDMYSMKKLEQWLIESNVDHSAAMIEIGNIASQTCFTRLNYTLAAR